LAGWAGLENQLPFPGMLPKTGYPGPEDGRFGPITSMCNRTARPSGSFLPASEIYLNYAEAEASWDTDGYGATYLTRSAKGPGMPKCNFGGERTWSKDPTSERSDRVCFEGPGSSTSVSWGNSDQGCGKCAGHYPYAGTNPQTTTFSTRSLPCRLRGWLPAFISIRSRVGDTGPIPKLTRTRCIIEYKYLSWGILPCRIDNSL